MARILRGDIRWADLNPVRGSKQGGLRPVLILSQNVFSARSGTAIAAAPAGRFSPHSRIHLPCPAEKTLGQDQPDPHSRRRAHRQKTR